LTIELTLAQQSEPFNLQTTCDTLLRANSN